MNEMEIISIASIILICVLIIVVKQHNEKNDKNSNSKEDEYQKMVEIVYKEKNKFSDKTIKPKDYNVKQVLTKYNKGTYRNSKGRYASLKND